MPSWLRWVLTSFFSACAIIVAWFAFGDPAAAFAPGSWWCKAANVARHPLYYYMVPPPPADVHAIVHDWGGAFVEVLDSHTNSTRIVEYFVRGSTSPDATVVIGLPGGTHTGWVVAEMLSREGRAAELNVKVGSQGSHRAHLARHSMRALFSQSAHCVACALCMEQVIGISFPQYGMTSPDAYYTPWDWPKVDLEPVLRAEGVDQFAIFSVSIGTVSAHTTLRHFGPERVTGIALLGPMLPPHICKDVGIDGDWCLGAMGPPFSRDFLLKPQSAPLLRNLVRNSNWFSADYAYTRTYIQGAGNVPRALADEVNRLQETYYDPEAPHVFAMGNTGGIFGGLWHPMHDWEMRDNKRPRNVIVQYGELEDPPTWMVPLGPRKWIANFYGVEPIIIKGATHAAVIVLNYSSILAQLIAE